MFKNKFTLESYTLVTGTRLSLRFVLLKARGAGSTCETYLFHSLKQRQLFRCGGAQRDNEQRRIRHLDGCSNRPGHGMNALEQGIRIRYK